MPARRLAHLLPLDRGMAGSVKHVAGYLCAIASLMGLALVAISTPALDVLSAATSASPGEVWVATDYAIGAFNGAEPGGARTPDVIRLDDGTYRMYYAATEGGASVIRYAESRDGARWAVLGTVLRGASHPADPEFSVSGPRVVRLVDGRFRMYYTSAPTSTQGPRSHVRSAISDDGVVFTREGVRINIAAYDLAAPFRLASHGAYFRVAGGRVVGILTGTLASGAADASHLTIGTSVDGLTFGNFRTLYNQWRDPVVIDVDGGYRLYATHQSGGQGTATSADGLIWPASMTPVTFVDGRSHELTEPDSGVGGLGAALLPSGLALFAHAGHPSANIISFARQQPGASATTPSPVPAVTLGTGTRAPLPLRIKSASETCGSMTFEVDVPANTPADAAVFMEARTASAVPGPFSTLPMVKVTPTRWRFSISTPVQTPGPQCERGTLEYRYNRDNMGFLSAEEFTPDSDAFRRSAAGMPGGVVSDTVTKWRWFPAPGEALPTVSSAAASTAIVDRVAGRTFQRGYMLADFWWSAMAGLIAPTDAAMTASHGNWVQLRPAWDYVSWSPPTLGYDGFGHTYKDGDLERNIAQAQRDGLNVLLMPQVCCATPPGDGTYSPEWWNAWFSEMERYAIHFATLAEAHHVTELVMQDDYLWGTAIGQVPDLKARYAHYIATIKQHYTGRLGFFASTGRSYTSPGDLYPSREDIDRVFSPEQFDFFAVSIWTGVANDTTPQVPAMTDRFTAIFDAALRPVSERYGKPWTIVSAAYPSIDGGMMGSTDVFDPDIQLWNAYTDKYTLDLVEQAEGYEALLQAIAKTPYITGLYPFTYWPLPLPQSKEHNIRGKPAEAIVNGWYERFAEKDSATPKPVAAGRIR